MREIREASDNEAIDLMLIDLSVHLSVREMAAAFKQRYSRLDVLINIAAVFKRQRTLTEDGLEMMFATNHLGPFLQLRSHFIPHKGLILTHILQNDFASPGNASYLARTSKISAL